MYTGVLRKNILIMRNMKSVFNYSLSSENSYLRLFQIAIQNLSLVLKEERSSNLGKKPFLGKGNEDTLRNEQGSN